MSSANLSDPLSPPAAAEVHTVSPAVRRRLQQCFEHARKLMAQARYDFDYAHTLLSECVTGDPGNLTYLDAFFENLARKYDNNKKGARLQLFTSRGAFKKSLAAKRWLDVLKAGPEILKTNPWDVVTLRGMAEACEHLRLNEAELRYLKNAVEGHPDDADVNRHCARSLARMGQYDQAIACWARVNELKRHDAEAQQMIGDLQIEKTKWKFGMLTPDDRKKQPAPAGQQGSEASVAGAEPEHPQPPAETPIKRALQLTRPQQLERAIHEDPSALENYLELAALYGEEGKLADAQRALERGLAVSGNDLRIRERLEEIHVARAQQQLAIAERRAQVEASDLSKELVKQLREGLNRLELDLYGHRSERYPQETRWKFELGVRLKRAGNYSEAIKRLAEIPADAELAAAAAVETGECWQHLRQFPRALQTYQEAANLSETSGQTDAEKLALYRGGVLGMAMGQAAGRELLARLVAIDPDYRDAKDRLSKPGPSPR